MKEHKMESIDTPNSTISELNSSEIRLIKYHPPNISVIHLRLDLGHGQGDYEEWIEPPPPAPEGAPPPWGGP